MCGIAGFVSVLSAYRDGSAVKRMTDEIAHRGPDDSTLYVDAFAELGHRRLSIIDVAGGAQPMANEDQSLWLVYNGEIFNHAMLRGPLESAGHVYGSHCDTETIIHSFEEYGPDCVTRFRGMFAFALWDKSQRRLFCARDRLGIKPFYYHWDGSTFVFGSEIKALLQHPSVSARFRRSALPEYLAFGYTSGEETMFEGIRKLMPGHTLTLDASLANPLPEIRQYWDVSEPDEQFHQSDAEWIADCRSRLEETVRMRLMSDVPLGMFLSGGIDSSAIAALIKRMGTGPVKTFSVGYSEAAYSELGYASDVAQTIGTEHHEVVIGMDDFFGALPELVWHEDEPIAWPSSVSLHFVSALAAEQVKVVLTGEGSDELFGGYARYRSTRLNLQLLDVYRKVAPAGVRRAVRSMISESTLLSRDLRRKAGHSFLGRDETLESLYLDNFYSAFPADERRAMGVAGDSTACSEFMRHWDARPHLSLLRRMLYADQKTYLVELLMKQDQMSMSASIESRVPFLDHTFVEFAMSVPDHLKIHKGTQKYILKEAVKDLLPERIIHRTKMGFPTPLTQWLREPRAEAILSYLLEPDGLLASCVDLDVVRTLLHRHRIGTHDGTDRIWRLLNLQIWGDLFITGRRDRWPAALTRPMQAAA